ncbi:MAG: ABC transporter permease [Acidimicrobiales bacterium]
MTATAPRRPLALPTSWVRGVVGVLVMFGFVELLTRAELVSADYLPPASSLVGESFGLLDDGNFWSAVGTTLWASFYGLVRAILIAVPVGLLLGLSKRAYRAAIVVVELLRPIPSVALIPLAILQFGLGTPMKAFLATYACLWPLLFNTIYGMKEMDEVGVDTARAFGLGGFRRALRVNLPAASPFIFTGVKIASSVALIVVIAAEIVAGGGGGLGVEIGSARLSGNVKLSYAYTLVTGVIGILLYIVLEALERRLFGWNRIGQADGR